MEPAAYDPPPSPPFALKRHVAYFKTCLLSLPEPYESLDTSRLNALFFCISALDVLGALDATLAKVAMTREQIIDIIYASQLLPSEGAAPSSPPLPLSPSSSPSADSSAAAAPVVDLACAACGFRGNFLGSRFDAAGVGMSGAESRAVDTGHIAMTFCALATLAVLGDGFERVQRDALVASLRALQQPSGSFAAVPVGGEDDLRFIYCACCISHMLQDWRGIDTALAVQYIERCRSYDGGIGMFPGSESHGGSTFCSLASLALIARRSAGGGGFVAGGEPDLGPTIDAASRCALVRWCVERMVPSEGGFQGRRHKVADTCYSWWVGASLKILGHYDVVPALRLRKFHASCAFAFGGFAKLPGEHPDILHSFMSILAHSMIAHDLALDGGGDLLKFGLQPIDPCLMIPVPAAAASPFGKAATHAV